MGSNLLSNELERDSLISTIVIGFLNTDIVAFGIKEFPQAGEHVFGKELKISPGGKSRNIAQMIATLVGKNKVSMVGKTVQDSYGLWKVPLEALQKVGVNTDFIKILPADETGKLPGVALIGVDQQGNNQIIVVPGVSNDFSPQEIDNAEVLFENASHSQGILALSLECPLSTAQYAINKAVAMGIKVVLDPGGIQPGMNIDNLLGAGVYLIKPNEHEAKILTGIDVVDYKTAQQSAEKLMRLGAENVLITVGKDGAYLFTGTVSVHIPIPNITVGEIKNETGCGDQTIATICAMLQENKNLEEATRLGILAGTLQFYKDGIVPLTTKEIDAFATTNSPTRQAAGDRQSSPGGT